MGCGGTPGRDVHKGSFRLRAGAHVVQTWSRERCRKDRSMGQRLLHVAGVGEDLCPAQVIVFPCQGERGGGVVSGQRQRRSNLWLDKEGTVPEAPVASFWGGLQQ